MCRLNGGSFQSSRSLPSHVLLGRVHMTRPNIPSCCFVQEFGGEQSLDTWLMALWGRCAYPAEPFVCPSLTGYVSTMRFIIINLAWGIPFYFRPTQSADWCGSRQEACEDFPVLEYGAIFSSDIIANNLYGVEVRTLLQHNYFIPSPKATPHILLHHACYLLFTDFA
jgi:hypothetical protein